jgi:hypothetical protein
MILFLICISSYQIDIIINKKILIHSIPYKNHILSENLSDFSPNVFHTKNLSYNMKGFNKISLIEKFNDKYRIKIGNYYVCENRNITCNYNSDTKLCMDDKYKEIDCDVCRTKTIKYCGSSKDLWDIERSSLGYLIRRQDMCFTLGFKLYLDTCRETKDQLFGFEDYELMSCLENFNPNKKLETRKDFIDSKKTKMNMKFLEKNDPEKYNKLTQNLEKRKYADTALEEIIPGIKKKKKMKKLWGKLWKHGFGGYHWPNSMKIKMLCTKWW